MEDRGTASGDLVVQFTILSRDHWNQKWFKGRLSVLLDLNMLACHPCIRPSVPTLQTCQLQGARESEAVQSLTVPGHWNNVAGKPSGENAQEVRSAFLHHSVL